MMSVSGIIGLERNVFDAVNEVDEKIEIMCNEMLLQYSADASKFTNCIATNARPIRMCRKCAQEYVNSTNSYLTIKRSVDCASVILDADRLQVIQKLYDDTTLIWNKANCDNCYYDRHGDDPYVLRNTTISFLSLAKETKTCFQDYNITVCPLDNNETNCQNQACFNCTKIYHTLNKNYRELQESFEFEDLCMDITDTMNTTRKMWSNDLDCIHHTEHTFLLFTIMGFICLLPITFYVSNWIQSDERKRKIIQQKRLTEKRLATSRSCAQLALN